MQLSIVIPCYNEAGRIQTTLDRIDLVMKNYIIEKPGFSYEILAVENGSTDNTIEILRSSIEGICNLSCIHSEKGKGNAIKKGVQEAKGEKVLVTDADNSTDISYVKEMLEKMDREDVDIVNSSRRMKGSKISVKQGALRQICGNTFHMLVKILFNLPVTDTQNGFKLFKTKSAREIYGQIQTSGWVTEVELFSIAKKSGLKVVEVPVTWNDEEGSTLGLADAPAIGKDLFKLWLNNMFVPGRRR